MIELNLNEYTNSSISYQAAEINNMYIARNIKQSKLNHAIPDFLWPILENYSVCLAGGAGRRFFGEQETADYDLFFVTGANDKLEEKDKVSDYLLSVGFEVIFLCEKDELRSFKRGDIKVQLIDVRDYLSPQEVINSFDINAGRFGFFGGALHFDRAALRDFRRKHISLHVLTYPAATINRIGKYKSKNPPYKTTYASQDFVRLLKEMIDNGVELSDVVYID